MNIYKKFTTWIGDSIISLSSCLRVYRKPVIKFDDIVNAITSQSAVLPNQINDDFAEISGMLRDIERVANSKELTISVVGEFSVGKSTFINALLGRDVMPAAAKTCTSVITKIRYGRKEKAIVKYEDREETMSIDGFKTFSSYSLDDLRDLETKGFVERLKGVKEAVIFLKSRLLEKLRICLVDTPGLGSNDIDNYKTLKEIKNSIAVLFVCSEKGLSAPDLRFIGRHIQNNASNLFIIINRCDNILSKKERAEIASVTKMKISGLASSQADRNVLKPLTDRIFLISSRYELISAGCIDREDDDFYSSATDYSAKSGFGVLMSGIQSILGKNAADTRKVYIKNQVSEIIGHIRAISSERTQNTDASIRSKQQDVASLQKEIDKIDKELQLIKEKYKTLHSIIKSMSFDLRTTCLNMADKQWKNDYGRVLPDIKFTNKDYIKLWNNDRYIFRSSSKKEKIASDILNNMSNSIVRELSEFVIKEHAELARQINDRVFKFISDEQLMDAALIGECRQKNGTIINLSNIDLSSYFNAVCHTISISIWKDIKSKRSALSVTNAYLHIMFKSEKNNRKRIPALIIAGKNAGMKEFLRQLDLMINAIDKAVASDIQCLLNKSNRKYIAASSKLKDTQLGIKKQISQIQALAISAAEHYDYIIDLLKKKMSKL